MRFPTPSMCARYILAFTGLLFFCALFNPLAAQTTFGSVAGIVTDTSGAATPDAQVTLVNLGTGEERGMMTNATGLYQFVNLTSGRYRVDVTKAGFKRFAREPIVVEVQATVRIDIALQVGDMNQTIEVKAETPLLQPETSSLGQVIDQRKVNQLPLNGRNPLNLAALVPSVVPQGGSMQNPNSANPFAWGNYQIGGGMANQSMVWLDGSPVNGGYLNITALIPTQDSLQEFKVQTSSLSPEFGRFGGGVINFTSKAGTNELHGGGWEFLRNKALNANGFFANQAGVERPAFTQNQFGANLGGPVYIPRIYNGRNKTFFFVNYEGFRLRQGGTYTETVPTAEQRTGNLSSLGVPIYDPLTTCGVGGGTPACAPGQPTRKEFANGVIPRDRFSPAAMELLNLYPLPNTAGNAAGLNNYVANASQGGNNNETVVRIDHNISDRQHLFARYTYWGNLNLPVNPYKNEVCSPCGETFNTNNFVLSDVFTINPTTILDVRASYQRFSYDRKPGTLGYDMTRLGWPAAWNAQAAFRVQPAMSISGFDQEGIFGGYSTGSIIMDRNDNDRIAGSLTKIAGSHTLKFGGEFLRSTHNYAQTNYSTGFFYFDPGFTSSNPLDPSGGLGLASFLLGYASNGWAVNPALVAARQNYAGLFVQDDWRITRKLTLNLGLRWEYGGPWTERFDRLSYFDPTTPNPLLQAAGLNYNGSIGLVNSSGYKNRGNIHPNWRQFSPRIGFAYQVAPKTVLRAAYGIFWLPNNVAWRYSPNNDPINSATTPFVASINNGLTPASTLDYPFPGGFIGSVGRNPEYQQQLLGQGIILTQLKNPYAYAQQWNFNIQQQLGNGFLFDIAYGGAKGTHLPIDAPQINQLPDQYLSLGSQLLESVPNPFYGLVTSGSLAAPTVPYGQLLRPFPQYGNVNYAGQGVANSSYHSLQVKVEKRFSNGASVLLAYTFAKLISNTDTITSWLDSVGGYQNYNNLQSERSLSSNDVPHRLVASYVMDLPFGKGRKFLSDASGFVNQLIGGWGVDGVTTFQTGFPLHFNTALNLTNSFSGAGSRPNVSAGCYQSTPGSAQSRLNGWFDTSCFSQPAAFTFGNEPRVNPSLRAAGIANWDFSAFKNFPLRPDAKLNLQFRAEFFNLFNRVQFGAPGQTFGTPQFGVVTGQQNTPRLVQFALRLGF